MEPARSCILRPSGGCSAQAMRRVNSSCRGTIDGCTVRQTVEQAQLHLHRRTMVAAS